MIWVLLLAACQNSCQKICGRMADYAEECGVEISSDEIAACREAQAGAASREDRAICRESGDGATIRDEWSCDDVETYFSRIRAPADTGTE